jgi:hypothetical protein
MIATSIIVAVDIIVLCVLIATCPLWIDWLVKRWPR